MMQSYFLAPHVYACVTEDHVVLLDLARDQYVGVARDQMAALAARVKGWPGLGIASADGGEVRTPNAGSNSGPSSRAEALLNKMLAAGMLTQDPAIGKEAHPLQMPSVTSPLVEPELEWRPPISFMDVVRFLRASATTALAMRFLSIRTVITALARRKAKAVAEGRRFDAEAARRATAAFIYLRPLVFGAQDACLYDSIALARFLSCYQQFPTCVIGVQTGPFGAHCWVQEGELVLNDLPEYVRRFTPILAV
jgi:hypothetical protein